jgi:hypothetical protein
MTTESHRPSKQKMPWLKTMLVHSILQEYRSSYQRYDDNGAGMQLVDLLTPAKEDTVSIGSAELLNLADFVAAAIAERSPDETPAQSVACGQCGNRTNYCSKCAAELLLSSAVKTGREDPLASVRWICPSCTTVNAIEDEVCCIGSCKTPRPASTRTPQP